MEYSNETLTTFYMLAAILGGVFWIGLNLALDGAWERGEAFPTYELVNALRPLPLALFAFALYGLYQMFDARIGRNGVYAALAGFFLLVAGAALEFWIGGGVRDGDVDTLSLAGWLIYLVGYLVLSIGLVMFGIHVLCARAWRTFSLLPLSIGIVWAAWFPLVMIGELMNINFSGITQYLFGLLWIGVGVLMTQHAASPTPVLD